MPLSDNTARQLIECLRGTTGNLNFARLLMDGETSELARAIIEDNNKILEQAERELSADPKAKGATP